MGRCLRFFQAEKPEKVSAYVSAWRRSQALRAVPNISSGKLQTLPPAVPGAAATSQKMLQGFWSAQHARLSESA